MSAVARVAVLEGLIGLSRMSGLVRFSIFVERSVGVAVK
jgi:hypothetical protein